jgi:hypothetical protein
LILLVLLRFWLLVEVEAVAHIKVVEAVLEDYYHPLMPI